MWNLGSTFQDDKCANLFEALVGNSQNCKTKENGYIPRRALVQAVQDDVDTIFIAARLMWVAYLCLLCFFFPGKLDYIKSKD